MQYKLKRIGSRKIIEEVDEDEIILQKRSFSNRIKRVFFAILDLMKTTNGIDKVLRFLQYFGYIQQFRMKLFLKNPNLQGKNNLRIPKT